MSLTAFISSTCFDLSQVRKDLGEFLQQLGIRPLMSESADFPVTPNQDVADNCYDAVRNDTDIYVLIVGSRYGSTDGAGVSITQREFEQAQAKGLPVICYIDRKTMDMLPVYDANPTAKFPGIDSTKVFDFAKKIKASGNVWVHPFSSAQDIVASLRVRLAGLFRQALKYWMTLHAQPPRPYMRALSTRAARMILERPKLWEYRLFAQCFQDEVDARSELRFDYKHGISMAPAHSLNAKQATDWVMEQMGRVSAIINNLGRILPGAIEEAVGPLGQPGDAEKVYFCAKRLGDIYGELMKWSIEVKRAIVPDAFEDITEILAKFPDASIMQIEEFCDNIVNQIEDAAKKHEAGEKVDLHLKLTVSIGDGLMAQFDETMKRKLKEAFKDHGSFSE